MLSWKSPPPLAESFDNQLQILFIGETACALLHSPLRTREELEPADPEDESDEIEQERNHHQENCGSKLYQHFITS